MTCFNPMSRPCSAASYHVQVEMGRPVYGRSGVAVFLHNTGSKNGRRLSIKKRRARFVFVGQVSGVCPEL